MEAHTFSSTHTIPSQSGRGSPSHSSNKHRTKTGFITRMKKLFSCGILQHKSASPVFEEVLSPDSRTNSKTDMNLTSTNQGDWHTVFCDGRQYTLPVRYQDPVAIGHGAFGAVIRATDTETGKYVAIKKMLKPFQTPTHAKRTYRELKLLMYLNHPDAQVVRLFNVFTPERNLNEFQTLYFVFNFADYDLNRVIRLHKPFTEEHIRLIIYSLLRGLKFMHSGGIIHRDLKPSNIGIDKDSNVTILDFGLARVASDGYLTGYVATRWWRAPEIYVSWERYDEKLDIWSVGCIMAELILLRPVFRGSDHIDQLNKIFDVLGTPDSATIDGICTPDTRVYIRGLTHKPKENFNQLFGFKYGPGSLTPISGVSPQGVDLLDRLLAFDHRLRPTAEEALADPFFAALRDPNDEPTIERMVDEHEDKTYTVTKWKSIIWPMVQKFQPPSWINDDDADDS